MNRCKWKGGLCIMGGFFEDAFVLALVLFILLVIVGEAN